MNEIIILTATVYCCSHEHLLNTTERWTKKYLRENVKPLLPKKKRFSNALLSNSRINGNVCNITFTTFRSLSGSQVSERGRERDEKRDREYSIIGNLVYCN